MTFAGSLELVPVTQLLQLIESIEATGCAQLGQGDVKTRLYFENGRLVACATTDPPRLLGQHLLFKGLIDSKILRECMATHEKSGEPLGDVLVAGRHIARQLLDEEVALKAEETVYGLFDIDGGTFRFVEKVKPDKGTMFLSMRVQDLLLRGAKRSDEQRRIRQTIGGLEAVPARTDKQPTGWVRHEYASHRIYEAIDGRRTIQEILLGVHGAEFAVTHAVARMIDEGLVELCQISTEPPPAAEPAPAATDARARNDRPAQQTSGTPGELPTTYLEQAEKLIGLGEFEQAVQLLGQAQKVDPSDSHLRRLMELAEQGIVDSLIAEGFQPNAVPIPGRNPTDDERAELTAEQEFLIPLCDGSWDVQSLLWVTPLTRRDLLATLKGLVRRGLLKLDEPAEVEQAHTA